MRTPRMPAWVLASLFIILPTAQAKTNYAYTANFYANTVSVINTTNNMLVKTIPVGSNPWGLAVNQAGSMAYVSNYSYGSGNISVISTSTNAVVATIPVGSGPLGIAFAPNGKTAYVADGLSNSVSVINTATKKVTATIAVQTYPYGIVVTPNGAFVYVANNGSGTVSVISTLTNAVVATIPVGGAPSFLAVSPDGSTIYVPDSANTISVLRVADNTVTNTITVDGAWGAAVSPDGHWMYSTDYGVGQGNLVTVIDTTTKAIATTIVVDSGPLEVSFSQDSALAYVANSGSSTVSVISTASKTVVGTITGVGSYPIGVSVMGTAKVFTVAGGYVGDKGPATNAAIGGPNSSVYDNVGNLYISDFFEHRIRKVDVTGNITTYAGTGICGYNGENVQSTKAMLCYPNGLALDPSGNLIAAGGSGRIQKIDHSSGKITTIAGTGGFGYTGDGGPALSAQVNQPYHLAYDSGGNLFFSQIGSCVVRKIDTSGIITTVAGNGTCGYSGDGGAAKSAMLNFPRGVAVDPSGNVYIGDTQNHRVRKVSGGIITTFAGTGASGFSGDGGLATNARVGNPVGLAVRSGLLYITNAGSSRVRTVDLATNIIQTYAGSYFGYDGDGNTLLATRFTGPRFIHFDSAGNPVFDDGFSGRVRKATGGIVQTIAGGYLGDGNNATLAALVFPEALAIDKSDTIYIADWTGNRVRKVSAGKMTTLAGGSINGYSGDGGLATTAMLNGPQGVAADTVGNVFIADTDNFVIRKVDSTGHISTFANNPNFSFLLQMATDAANNLYIADAGACVVWKVTAGGVVSVYAGVLYACGYNGDGISATTAQLNYPSSVTVDAGGNLLIADNGNNRVRQVTGGGISTVAGNGVCDYTGDGGPPTSAELCPYSVAVNKSGAIFVADNFLRVRKIAGGTITTFAGTGGVFNGDKLWPLLTSFDDLVAVAVDSKGGVYVLDDVEHRVREIK